ncbi:hypothetical protein FKW77_003229 [Venturia effusa]|uniref:Uncharacterized protein n=1 Tax=Venturia effusa TaxID=50376 RepID=A0A517LDI3_9PEZI|nr:hypothetical protein FKW77_003229 [Venturia effusa]
MRFASIISVAFATAGLTSAMALPKPAIEAVDAVSDSKPKNDPFAADLHHISANSLCGNISDQSKKQKCQEAIAKCDKKKKDNELEKCEESVKKTYQNSGGNKKNSDSNPYWKGNSNSGSGNPYWKGKPGQ